MIIIKYYQPPMLETNREASNRLNYYAVGLASCSLQYEGILVLTPSADAFYVEGRRVRPCGLVLADGTVWGSSSKRPYRAPFGALLVALGFPSQISS